jgi:hypothetical protein
MASETAFERSADWQPEGYYLWYHLTAGFINGGLAAGISLMFNLIGAAIVGLFPLQLIRVYLTFPLGEKALELNSGLALGVGCLLYVGTGHLYGMIFHYIFSRYYNEKTIQQRFIAATAMGLVLWLINFYAILSWLQPMLFGGNWIISEIPFYIAALTHLVFAWSVMLLSEIGMFDTQWQEAPAAGND